MCRFSIVAYRPTCSICSYILSDAGQSIKSVLSLLKERHPPLHDALIAELNNYSTCVGLLDQSYFKRDHSGQSTSPVFDRHHFLSSPASAAVISLVFHRAIVGADRRPSPLQSLLQRPTAAQHVDSSDEEDTIVNRTSAVSAAEHEPESSQSGVDRSQSVTAGRSSSHRGANTSGDTEPISSWFDDDRSDFLR